MGDAPAPAYRAGASLRDMEFVQFHPTVMVTPEEMRGKLVTEAVRGEGGRLFNAEGERFRERYSPDKMELDARDVVARGVFAEIQGGRGTEGNSVLLDITHRDDSSLRELMWEHAGIVRSFRSLREGLGKWENLSVKANDLHVDAKSIAEPKSEWALNLYSMMLTAETVLRGAMMRNESRGAHYRDDAPDSAPAWERNILYSQGTDEEIQLVTEPLPRSALRSRRPSTIGPSSTTISWSNH